MYIDCDKADRHHFISEPEFCRVYAYTFSCCLSFTLARVMTLHTQNSISVHKHQMRTNKIQRQKKGKTIFLVFISRLKYQQGTHSRHSILIWNFWHSTTSCDSYFTKLQNATIIIHLESFIEDNKKNYTKIANIETKERTMLPIILEELFNWNKYMQGIFKLKNDYVEIYYYYSCFVTTMSEKSAGISKFPFSFEYFFVSSIFFLNI